MKSKDKDYLEILMSRDGLPQVRDEHGVWHDPNFEKKVETGEMVYIWGGFRKPRWRPYDTDGPKEVA
jgi:hypothetical protein